MLWWSRYGEIPLPHALDLQRDTLGCATVRPNASLVVVACFSRIDKRKVRSEETRKVEGQRPDGESEFRDGGRSDGKKNATFQKAGVGRGRAWSWNCWGR